jgi:hypothetical protein
VTARLAVADFDRMYAGAEDTARWYERRKDAITLALLPDRRYRHAFQPDCSIGTLTAQLVGRCDHVTAMDVADAALRSADARLRRGTKVVAAHWRHRVPDYPLTGDAAHAVIAETPGLTSVARYGDRDVVIEAFDTGDGRSVAAREGLPGAD